MASPGWKPLTLQALINLITAFVALKGVEVDLILDGAMPGVSDLELKPIQNFKIINSDRVTADTCIEKVLCENKAKGVFWVVTEDRALCDVSRGFGARVLAPGEFMELLRECERQERDIAFERKVDAHRFNRPLDDKLKNFPS